MGMVQVRSLHLGIFLTHLTDTAQTCAIGHAFPGGDVDFWGDRSPGPAHISPWLDLHEHGRWPRRKAVLPDFRQQVVTRRGCLVNTAVVINRATEFHLGSAIRTISFIPLSSDGPDCNQIGTR